MARYVEQERRRCKEKPADNSPVAIGKGFDAADASFLFNPAGAANFDACLLKPLAISAKASGGAVFANIHSKFDPRRTAIINRS